MRTFILFTDTVAASTAKEGMRTEAEAADCQHLPVELARMWKEHLPELRAAMTCISSLKMRRRKSCTHALGFNTAAALDTNAAVKGPPIWVPYSQGSE